MVITGKNEFCKDSVYAWMQFAGFVLLWESGNGPKDHKDESTATWKTTAAGVLPATTAEEAIINLQQFVVFDKEILDCCGRCQTDHKYKGSTNYVYSSLEYLMPKYLMA